jgi:integrase
MKARLTDVFISTVKPPEKGQADYFDNLLSGFGVRVSQGGTKTFFVMVQRKRTTIGRYPLVPLSDARNRARTLLLNQALRRSPSIPYDEAVKRYIEQRSRELRKPTVAQYQRLLTLRFPYGSTLLSDIDTHEITGALDRIEGQTERSHSYTVLKVFFNWAIQRDYCQSNPLVRIKKPRMPDAKERVLSDDEIQLFWSATEQVHLSPFQDVLHHNPYYSLLRFLLLTGQRANQAAHLHESWVRDGTIVFPREIMKAKREHTIPLLPRAEAILNGCKPKNGYFFSQVSSWGAPFTAWSSQKKILDTRLTIPHWTVHDLRRTWSTIAARCDVPPHIIERVLAHVQPEGKVAAIYNRYKYHDQMRDALGRVEEHILTVLAP